MRILFLVLKWPLISLCIHIAEKKNKLSGIAPYTGTNPSNPNYLPKASPSNIITLGVKTWTYRFWGDTYIQSITQHTRPFTIWTLTLFPTSFFFFFHSFRPNHLCIFALPWTFPGMGLPWGPCTGYFLYLIWPKVSFPYFIQAFAQLSIRQRWLILAKVHQEHTSTQCWVSWLVAVGEMAHHGELCGVPGRVCWKKTITRLKFLLGNLGEESMKHCFALRLSENEGNFIIGHLNHF